MGYSPFTTLQSYPYKFMAAAHPSLEFKRANIPGTTYAQRAPSLSGRVDRHLANGNTVLVDDGGVYDVEDGFGNLDATGVLAVKTAYTAGRRAAGADRIVGLTIAPSLMLTGDEETIRQTVNAALIANPGTYGYDQIVNLDAVAELANASNATYYYDGTHWSDAATTLVAQKLQADGV